MKGSFIISLDFELHWGGPEKWDISKRREYFLNTRAVVPEILSLFQEYGIRATWATVGFLFSDHRDELISFFPDKKPHYKNDKLNYYQLFTRGEVGENEKTDPFHFGKELIHKIIKTSGQEVGSHTFCHYYCNEEGQTAETFSSDLRATQNIASVNFDLELQSLVLPRNQFNPEYLKIMTNQGYGVVRSNPDVWFWKRPFPGFALVRAVDTLVPVSKRLSFKKKDIKTTDGIVLLPASRFFRPYIKKEKFIQKLKLRRIKNEMTRAAKKKEHYHLWWHPHNFGDYPKENLEQLRIILDHYLDLNNKYGFASRDMRSFLMENHNI